MEQRPSTDTSKKVTHRSRSGKKTPIKKWC